MVGRGGFEPPKASPTDLQSVPFDRSGTSPKTCIDKAGRDRKNTDTPLFGPFDKTKFTKMRKVEFLPGLNNLWSWRRELNPQPTDYKSVALPIELRQPGTFSPCIFPEYKRLILISCKGLVKKKITPLEKYIATNFPLTNNACLW